MRPLVHKISILILLAVFLSGKASADIWWCETGRTPGSVSGNVSYGTSINWSQPNRSIGSDNLYSNASFATGDITKYLLDKEFSFNVPASANITGITVYIERYKQAEAANIRDYSIRLQMNGVTVGTEHATDAAWSATEGIVVFGGSSDSWGLTLTAADVNSSTFGVLTSAYIPAGGSSTVYDAYVDNVEVVINFQMTTNTCGPYNLPVDLGDFKAKVIEDSKVQLNWITYSEINNDYFTVERSEDGLNFEPVLKVSGIGNSTELNSYEAIDTKPLPGISYYRLKQTDYDGKETIEDKILTVRLRGRDSPFTVYPNPSDGFSFRYSCPVEPGEDFWIVVKDHSGKEVISERRSSTGLDSETLVFNERLKPGVYTIFNIGASQSYRDRLLVKN
jgi:hypothetical protein